MAPFIKAFARSLPKKYIGLIDYFLFRPTKSYAQHGEDIIAYNFFNYHGPKKGVYVDIGCFHPKRHSSTFLLHKRGWHGLNIDVDSYKVDVFKFIRPHDVNINVAISDRRGTADLFFQDESIYGSMSGLDEACMRQETEVLGRHIRKRTVETMPLIDVLLEHSIDKIDFLSIDVEGHEATILGAFDFEKYPIPLLAVETQGEFEELQTTAVHKLLSSGGYKLYARSGPTTFYVRCIQQLR